MGFSGIRRIKIILNVSCFLTISKIMEYINKCALSFLKIMGGYKNCEQCIIIIKLPL